VWGVLPRRTRLEQDTKEGSEGESEEVADAKLFPFYVDTVATDSSEARPVFAMPLGEAITYASITISTPGKDGNFYVRFLAAAFASEAPVLTTRSLVFIRLTCFRYGGLCQQSSRNGESRVPSSRRAAGGSS
jgi:hypothetical protein